MSIRGGELETGLTEGDGRGWMGSERVEEGLGEIGKKGERVISLED